MTTFNTPGGDLRANAAATMAVAIVALPQALQTWGTLFSAVATEATLLPEHMAGGGAPPPERTLVLFEDASVTVGLWEAPAHATVVMPYPASEYCQ